MTLWLWQIAWQWQCSTQYALLINIEKTKVFVFSKANTNANQSIKGNIVQQVSPLKYLVTIVNDQIDPKKAVRARIEQARKVFTLFTRSDLGMELQSCESWTLNPSLERNLGHSKCTCMYRRMLRIPWIQRVRNEEVLRPMGKQKKLLTKTTKNKLCRSWEARSRNFWDS